MNMIRIAEYENQKTVSFIIWLLRQIDIPAQAQPLVGADYSQITRNFKPNWAIVVPKKDKTYAELALEVLPEFNWKGDESDKELIIPFLKELKRRLEE